MNEPGSIQTNLVWSKSFNQQEAFSPQSGYDELVCLQSAPDLLW